MSPIKWEYFNGQYQNFVPSTEEITIITEVEFSSIHRKQCRHKLAYIPPMFNCLNALHKNFNSIIMMLTSFNTVL